MVFDYVPPADVLRAVLIACALCLLVLGVSSRLHARTIARVPLRIHVGGSRGKTSTARYIGAALRAAGRRVLVKTTGTRPILILPDGTETAWRRWGAPSIAETARFFRRAARLRVDAVVLESMAIEPEYLWASETYLVRATHVVLTNARPDHAEVLGTADDAMPRALSHLTPRGGRLFLSSESDLPPIRQAAHEKRAMVTHIPTEGLPPDQSNRRMARAVCESLGIAPDLAEAAFDRAGEDPGSFFSRDIEVAGRKLRFHNAFACNDVVSLSRLWAENATGETPIVLLNARADRPERTRLFLEFLASLPTPVHLVMTGAWRKSWIRRAGLDPDEVRVLKEKRPEAVLAGLAAIAGSAPVWGIGNYADIGQALADHVRARDVVPC